MGCERMKCFRSLVIIFVPTNKIESGNLFGNLILPPKSCWCFSSIWFWKHVCLNVNVSWGVTNIFLAFLLCIFGLSSWAHIFDESTLMQFTRFLCDSPLEVCIKSRREFWNECVHLFSLFAGSTPLRVQVSQRLYHHQAGGKITLNFQRSLRSWIRNYH